MIKLGGFVVVSLVATAGLALSSCGTQEPDKLFRYKMTIEVETPQGLRSASSVRELRYHPASSFPFAQSRPQIDFTGEAVAVDLPGERTLFALLTSSDGDVDYAGRIVDRAGLWSLENPRPNGTSIKLWPSAPDTEKLKNSSPIPMFVTFESVSDPTSVAKVDPNDLEIHFGRGVTLKKVSITITDAKLKADIGHRLKWLSKYPEPSLKPNHAPDDWSIAATLKHGAFRTGAIK